MSGCGSAVNVSAAVGQRPVRRRRRAPASAQAAWRAAPSGDVLGAARARSTGAPKMAGASARTAGDCGRRRRSAAPAPSGRSPQLGQVGRPRRPARRARASTAARARFSRVALRGGQAAQHAGGVRPVRGPLAVQVGQQGQPARAGLGGQRQRGQPGGSVPSSGAVASSTRPALIVHTSGRNRPVASAKPATAPVGVGGRHRADRERRARRADRDGHVARVAGRARARRPCCRRCPADSAAPQAVRPTTSAGRGHPRQRDRRARGRRSARSGSQRAVRGGEVAGARGVAAVGDRLGRPVPPSARPPSPGARSASRAAAAPAPARCGAAGSWSASQRSLVTVNEAAGTLPVSAAHQPGRPARRSARAACGADRRSFHEQRGPDHLARLVQGDHAVLLAGHADRGGAVQQAVARPACSASTRPPGRPRCRPDAGARRWPTTVPSSAWHSTTLLDWVERVHSGDQHGPLPKSFAK